MVRPRRRRYVRRRPSASYYKPRGVPMRQLNEVVLKLEEVEALRLSNLEELSQEQAAEKMKVSRSTFQRTLKDAEKKVTDGLVNGKALRIEGGNYQMPRRVRGRRGRGWDR